MKTFRIVFIAIVLLAFLAPSVLMLFGVGGSSGENRVLARLPKLLKNGKLNTDFFNELDDYTEDHFAFRSALTEAFNRTDIALFGDVNGTSAVIGREGYIFYGETVNDHLGIGLLAEEEIEAIASYLSAVQTELEGRGIRFAFITAPNKATVYPELMPGWLRPTGGARNIDLLRDALEGKKVSYIDAKGLLIAAKGNREVYYPEDSHWNNFGAMLVYDSAAALFGLEEYDPEVFTTALD
ncbi:MAG: hypothetical protein IKS68_07015, partial [Mailhella sp.]|nr:hypothetical protein [Mailhella sp.]